jgi:hypothetical protein
MKPLLRAVLVINALIFLTFGVVFLLTPLKGLYGSLQLTPVEPAFAGQVLGIVLVGLAWLGFHAAIDGALTATAAKVSGHVEWLSGVVVLVWLLALHTPRVEGFGQVLAALIGIVLLVLGLISVRLARAVRRRERATQAGAASASRAERRAAQKRAATAPATGTAASPASDPVTGRRLDHGGVVDPATGRTIDPATGRTIDPATGRTIDPVTGARIDPGLAPDALRRDPR